MRTFKRKMIALVMALALAASVAVAAPGESGIE